jgi:hypothetical protein
MGQQAKAMHKLLMILKKMEVIDECVIWKEKRAYICEQFLKFWNIYICGYSLE